jgi:hypothetical protein
MWQSRHKWRTVSKERFHTRGPWSTPPLYVTTQTLVDTGRYMPHQGKREKARRAHG